MDFSTSIKPPRPTSAAPTVDTSGWSAEDVANWTRKTFQGRLEQQMSAWVLKDNIDGNRLGSLGHADLRGAGVTFTALRNKVLEAIKNLKNGLPPQKLGTPTKNRSMFMLQRTTPNPSTASPPRRSRPNTFIGSPRFKDPNPGPGRRFLSDREPAPRVSPLRGSPVAPVRRSPPGLSPAYSPGLSTPVNSPAGPSRTRGGRDRYGESPRPRSLFGRFDMNEAAPAEKVVPPAPEPPAHPTHKPRPLSDQDLTLALKRMQVSNGGANRRSATTFTLLQGKEGATSQAAVAELPEWNVPANIPKHIVQEGDNHPVNVLRRQFRKFKMGDATVAVSENTALLYGSTQDVRWIKVEGSLSPHGDIFYTGMKSIDSPQQLEDMKQLAIEAGAVAFTESGWFKHTLWPVRNWVTPAARHLLDLKLQLDLHHQEWSRAKMTCWVRETDQNKWDRTKEWGVGFDKGTQIEALATMMEGSDDEAMILDHLARLCDGDNVLAMLGWRCWNKGGTLLHVAAARGHCWVLEYLLNGPRAPSLAQGFRRLIDAQRQGVKASDGCTPLHCASWHHQDEAVKVLKKYGAREDIRNQYGELAADFKSIRSEKRAPVPMVTSSLPSICKAFKLATSVTPLRERRKGKMQKQMEAFRRRKAGRMDPRRRVSKARKAFGLRRVGK